MMVQAIAPMLPVMDTEQLSAKPRALPEPWGNARWCANARAGIAIALQDSGLEPGDTIWVPSYYCLAMTAPIEHVGMKVRFYELTESLEIDLPALKRQYDLDVRAIVVPHFFGFPQNSIEALRKYCSERSIFMIEDCAQALLGRIGDRRLGTIGDYAVASLPKFFPVVEGGLVTTQHGRLDATTYRPSLKSQLDVWASTVRNSMQWGRDVPKGGLAGWTARRSAKNDVASPPTVLDLGEDSPSAYEFSDDTMTRGVGHATRFAVERTDLNAMAQRRRENFEYYLEAAKGWPQARPLFSELPQGVVPYMFPVELRMPAQQLPALRARGVPLRRWSNHHPEFSSALCPIGARYAVSVIHLPVHQSLTDEESERISHALFDVLR